MGGGGVKLIETMSQNMQFFFGRRPLDKEFFTSMILAPNLVMQSLTVLEDHCATVKWITISSGHSSPSAYLAQYEQ